MDFIPVEIVGLSTSPSSGGAYALVLGEVDGNRRLPIIIGASEAQAIALELEKIEPPRPMTHDLLREVFLSVDAEVSEVVIDELRDGTFYAKIKFSHDGEEKELDARPSDAVALAVRVEVPIFVEVNVLEEAGIPTDEEGGIVKPEEAEEPQLSTLERLQSDLEKAIEQEDYEQAAKLRDEIAKHSGSSN